MYTFHVTLHARPAGVLAADESELQGRRLTTLRLHAAATSTPFGLSFEQAAAALAQLPRMFVEPDGSFVWSSSSHDTAWQVDGVLYDRNERLLFVDLKGSCPAEAFDELLRTLGWPETALVFQLTREAVYVDEPTFRQWASLAVGRGQPAEGS